VIYLRKADVSVIQEGIERWLVWWKTWVRRGVFGDTDAGEGVELIGMLRYCYAGAGA